MDWITNYKKRWKMKYVILKILKKNIFAVKYLVFIIYIIEKAC